GVLPRLHAGPRGGVRVREGGPPGRLRRGDGAVQPAPAAGRGAGEPRAGDPDPGGEAAMKRGPGLRPVLVSVLLHALVLVPVVVFARPPGQVEFETVRLNLASLPPADAPPEPAVVETRPEPEPEPVEPQPRPEPDPD